MRDAARLVRRGQVLSLAVPLNPRTPTDPSRPPMQHFGKNVLLSVRDHGWPGESQFADDWISMSPQTGTQWDGLTHAFRDNKVWNGYDAGQALNPLLGARRNAIDAADGVWDFMFVAQPLRLSGGIGSPINPLAIR